MLKGKIIEINETDPHFFTYFLVADTVKYIIGKFDYKIMSILYFLTLKVQNLELKKTVIKNALPILTRLSINSVLSFKITFP